MAFQLSGIALLDNWNVKMNIDDFFAILNSNIALHIKVILKQLNPSWKYFELLTSLVNPTKCLF